MAVEKGLTGVVDTLIDRFRGSLKTRSTVFKNISNQNTAFTEVKRPPEIIADPEISAHQKQ